MLQRTGLHSTINKRAVIAGAGPGGLTAAIALQQAGYRVTLCDRIDVLKPAGSGLTLWPNAMRAFDRVGLNREIASLGVPLVNIAMRNWHGDLIFADEVLAAARDQRFQGLSLTRTSLMRTLALRAQPAKILQVEVVDFTACEDFVLVRLADSRKLACDLLVGADGLHSRVRAQLIAKQDLTYAGYAVTRGIAEGNFAGDTGTVWMGPARQFGCFPLPQDRTYWFASEKSSEKSGDSPPSPIAEIVRSFERWTPAIVPMIHATSQDQLLRNQIYDRPTLRKWSFGRVTMLGDAAHPAAPTLGQGGCQAIEDAVTLGFCCAAEDDVDAALRKYQSLRLARANSFVREARMMGRIGLWQNPLALYVRERIMRAIPMKYRQSQLAHTFDFNVSTDRAAKRVTNTIR
jgi:2-polyprenyl-6-methoxyphenol hydroxylase-like FAD-dependent oxidoreductase